MIDEHRGSAADVTDAILADVMSYQSDDARDDIAVVTVAVE